MSDLTNSILDSSVVEKPKADIVAAEVFDPNTGVGFEFKEKVARLQEALLSSHPSMPVLLRDIHTHLRKDPEIVTLLTEDEIGCIVNGLKKQTQTEIVTAPAKKTSATAGLKKALKGAGSSSVDLF